jgi:hypothetical protein
MGLEGFRPLPMKGLFGAPNWIAGIHPDGQKTSFAPLNEVVVRLVPANTRACLINTQLFRQNASGP